MPTFTNVYLPAWWNGVLLIGFAFGFLFTILAVGRRQAVRLPPQDGNFVVVLPSTDRPVR